MILIPERKGANAGKPEGTAGGGAPKPAGTASAPKAPGAPGAAKPQAATAAPVKPNSVLAGSGIAVAAGGNVQKTGG